MKKIKGILGRGSRLFVVAAFGVAVLAPSLLPAMQVDALLLTNRKITMASTQEGDVSTDAHGVAVAAGAAGNGAQTRHTYTFTLGTSAATIGSMAVMYCTTPLIGNACTSPTGMDAATITTVQSQSGSANTYVVDTTTDASTATGVNYFANDTNACSGTGVARQNCILVKDTTPVAETGTPTFTIAFGTSGTDWIKNPTDPGVFYVRILTFSDAAFTTVVDDGAVAGSVNEDIEITAKVQEKLNFSVSSTSNAAGTTCAALPVGGTETMGAGGVLDHTVDSFVTSYFRLSTNAAGGTGTLVQYAGDTLKTSGGTDSITALTTTAVASSPGTPQFGFTLDSTDAGYSFTNLTRTSPYNADTTFAFDTTSLTAPKTVASATAGTTVTCDTGAVKYVGNISTTTKPGTYKTNILYFAVPTF